MISERPNEQVHRRAVRVDTLRVIPLAVAGSTEPPAEQVAVLQNGENDLSCGALLSSLFVSGCPGVREQLVEPAMRPGADARQDVGDVAARVDARGVGSGGQGQLVGEALGARVGAGKQPGFTPRGQ